MKTDNRPKHGVESPDEPLLTIYGFGYVGRGLIRFLKDHYALVAVDPNPDKKVVKELGITVFRSPKEAPATPYGVICVPTPDTGDGTCDTSIVEEVLKGSTHEHYLIKSTVVPGTTERLIKQTKRRIVFSPEFMGEGKYEIPYWKNYPHPTNMKLHSFHIFGGEREETQVWVNLWQKVAGWAVRYYQTTSTTAELQKYMENAFLATKKIFCDEFYDIARAFGVNYSELRELWLLDERMGSSQSLIFPESRGFGGKCLPKDVVAIVKAAEEKGYSAELIKEVLRSNNRFRTDV